VGLALFSSPEKKRLETLIKDLRGTADRISKEIGHGDEEMNFWN
jgi:hypothetical protein